MFSWRLQNWSTFKNDKPPTSRFFFFNNFFSYTSTSAFHIHQVHVLLAEQHLFSSNNKASSSYFASHINTIRAHLDAVIWFPSDDKLLRSFLQNIWTGNSYRKVKKIAQLATTDTLANFSNSSLFEYRECFPYLVMILNKSSNRHFKYRESLYNLHHKKSLPHVPPAFIWGKSEDFHTPIWVIRRPDSNFLPQF